MANVQAQLDALQRKKAKKTEAPHFTSWGWTRYNDYKLCPLKAKLKHIDHIDEPGSEPMTRGSAIGRLAEVYVRGTFVFDPKNDRELVSYCEDDKPFAIKLAKLVAKGGMVKELQRFEKLFKKLRAQAKRYPHTVEVEGEWAFDAKMRTTSWFGKDTWLRVKVDVGQSHNAHEMVIIDWKTGKVRDDKTEEYMEQLELYAFGAFHHHPQLQTAEVKLCYLDSGITYPDDFGEKIVFRRSDVPKLKKAWDKRTRAMLLDRHFAPRPNDKCRWCFYRKENTANLPGKKALCKY